MQFFKKLPVFLLLCICPFYALAQFEVLGSLVHKKSAMPGDVYNGEIIVRNIGEKEQEIKIYLRDYLFNHEGVSFYDEPVSHKRSNTPWMEFNPKNAILAPKGGTQIIKYTVTVPKNDSLKGTYWSLLMIEGVKQLNPAKQGQLNISTSIRYAVQIVSNMGQTGIGELSFAEPFVSKEEDKLYLDVNISNTGERLISPLVSVELFDTETGESLHILDAPKAGLYPSTSSRFRFSLEKVAQNKNYQALIIADGEGEDVFGIEYELAL